MLERGAALAVAGRRVEAEAGPQEEAEDSAVFPVGAVVLVVAVPVVDGE